MAQLLGIAYRRSVPGYLIMLHALCLRNKPGVHNIIVPGLVDKAFRFLYQAFHRLAFLAIGIYVQFLADFLQALLLSLRLLKVAAEGFLEFTVVGVRFHLGQGLDKLLFGTVKVFELMFEKFFKIFHVSSVLKINFRY